MWSSRSNARHHRARLTKGAMLALALVLLGGCFRPMYGGPDGQALRQELAAIEVHPIPERIGHYLANDLMFELNGTGSSVPAKYDLHVQVRQQVQSPLIDTVTGQATSATIAVDAIYRLVPKGQETPLVQGTAFTTVAYDRTGQRFAGIRAARDAEIRAAKDLAQQIKLRLASALLRAR